jgi:nucleoside-diphosphate-sugar epimerase
VKVLVAGATSVPGIPVVKALIAGGHEVVGLTRSPSKGAAVAAAGGTPVVGDVLDADQITDIIGTVAPDAVIALLTTLPKYGPMQLWQFKPAIRLWRDGATNLLAAAQQAGVRRVVAESVVFAYGYGPLGSVPLDESDPYPGPPPVKRGKTMLEALRGMERAVLASGQSSSTEGVVLRYGLFHGAGVPHAELMARMAKLWLMPVPGGGAVHSWIALDDVAHATAAAVEHGRDGELYNIVDDEPVSFRNYLDAVAAQLHRPKPLGLPNALVRLGSPYVAAAFDRTQAPISNAKAKRELHWAPKHADYRSVVATVGDAN